MFLGKAASQVLPVVVCIEVSLPSACLVFLNIYFLIYKSRMKQLDEMWLRWGDKMLPPRRQNSSILLSITAKQVSVSIANSGQSSDSIVVTAWSKVSRVKLYFCWDPAQTTDLPASFPWTLSLVPPVPSRSLGRLMWQYLLTGWWTCFHRLGWEFLDGSDLRLLHCTLSTDSAAEGTHRASPTQSQLNRVHSTVVT